MEKKEKITKKIFQAVLRVKNTVENLMSFLFPVAVSYGRGV